MSLRQVLLFCLPCPTNQHRSFLWYSFYQSFGIFDGYLCSLPSPYLVFVWCFLKYLTASVSYELSFVIYPVSYWTYKQIIAHSIIILSALTLVMTTVYNAEREQRIYFIKIRNLQLQQDAVDAEAKRTGTLLEKYAKLYTSHLR